MGSHRGGTGITYHLETLNELLLKRLSFVLSRRASSRYNLANLKSQNIKRLSSKLD